MEALIWRLISHPATVTAVALGATLGTLAIFFRIIGAIRRAWAARAARRLAAAIRSGAEVPSFTDEDIDAACRNYIHPNCTQVDPSDEGDLRNVVALAPLFESVDNHLNVGGEKRHIILLADSGMGKTSFCINYYARERRKRTRDRRKVAVIPLGRSNALEQIRSISDKRETVLFLDAFDEDPKAIGREAERLVDLMRAAADCRNIIVTCRSQFFRNDDSIPSGSGIMYAAPRRAGAGREFPLHKLFLAPLTPRQIEKFLSRHFPYHNIRNWSRRSKARSLVASIPELSVRPMLLELLPDLVRERKRIDQLFGLYQFLVKKWLERERDWISEQDLLEISKEIAVQLFLAQRSGQGDRMSQNELDRVAQSFNSPIEGWKLRSRSLLNRDIEGNFKFAHRSIMEYLFLCAALQGDSRCFKVEWTDLMKDLLVSFGNTSPPPFDVDMDDVLSTNLEHTKIWPLASPLRLPRRVSYAEIKKSIDSDAISTRHSRKIPAAWRNRHVKVQTLSSVSCGTGYRVVDPTHGLEWNLVMPGEEERIIFREKYIPPGTDSDLRIGGSDFLKRLPSLDEMITLWEAHCYLKRRGEGLLLEDEMYWIGDSSDTGPLCCSFGRDELERPFLRHLEARSGKGDARFHVYEFGNRYGHVNRAPFLAMSAHLLEPKQLSSN